jgi:GNAT superfamily N-acetyltransferase
VSRRSNSANPDSPRAALTDGVIDDIEAAYAAAGQPAYVRIPSFLDEGVEHLLRIRGYESEGASLTLAAGLPVAAFHPEAELEPGPSLDWLHASNRINARSPGDSETFSSILARLTVPSTFAAVREEGAIVSLAYGAVHGGWLCIEAVATDPVWRGRGLARRAVEAVMVWGATRGATAAGLQVQVENAAAQSVYRRLGFDRELYRYHYRRAPGT